MPDEQGRPSVRLIAKSDAPKKRPDSTTGPVLVERAELEMILKAARTLTVCHRNPEHFHIEKSGIVAALESILVR